LTERAKTMRTQIRVDDYPQPARWQEEQPAIGGEDYLDCECCDGPVEPPDEYGVCQHCHYKICIGCSHECAQCHYEYCRKCVRTGRPSAIAPMVLYYCPKCYAARKAARKEAA
jgi:hypothetical protein